MYLRTFPEHGKDESETLCSMVTIMVHETTQTRGHGKFLKDRIWEYGYMIMYYYYYYYYYHHHHQLPINHYSTHAHTLVCRHKQFVMM